MEEENINYMETKKWAKLSNPAISVTTTTYWARTGLDLINVMWFVCDPSCFVLQTHVDGAAQQRSGLQGLLDDLEKVGGGSLEVVVLSDAAGEILEALGGGTAR